MIKFSHFFRLLFLLLLFANATSAHALSNYQQAIMRASHHQLPLVHSLRTLHGQTVVMVTLTEKPFKLTDKNLKELTWTTVYPDIKRLCSQQHKKNATPYLLKLLGMPIKHTHAWYVVTFEVPIIQAYYGPLKNSIGIFRPCSDPRIDAHHDRSVICPRVFNNHDKNIDSQYKKWLAKNAAASYQLKNGYPWTMYGYTYNWNENAKSKVGVSEFVVLPKTPIHVLQVMRPNYFCHA